VISLLRTKFYVVTFYSYLKKTFFKDEENHLEIVPRLLHLKILTDLSKRL